MENRMNGDCSCGERRHGFGMIFPLIAIPLVIGMMRGMVRHKMMHMEHMGGRRAGWENGVPPMFAELHRRAHAAEAKAREEIKES